MNSNDPPAGNPPAGPDWESLEKNFKEFKKKIEKGIFRGLEKLESAHYKNVRSVDASRERIHDEWNQFENEFRATVEAAREKRREGNEKFANDIAARRGEMDAKLKTWQQKYEAWSDTAKKSVKESLQSLSLAGWKFYLSFLAVIVPIVIIIVVLVNAFK